MYDVLSKIYHSEKTKQEKTEQHKKHQGQLLDTFKQQTKEMNSKELKSFLMS